MKHRTSVTIVAGLASAALLLSACGGSSDEGSGEGGEVTLTVATFNEFGYEALFEQYMEENPNVTIEHKKAATTNEARDNMNTRLAAGSGLSDIEAVEVNWLPDLMLSADKFEDLASDDVKDRWLNWKTDTATTADGKLIGYGTDIGPEAVCYRADLFKAAGLPTDREEVAAMLGSSWEDYFAAGKKFVAKSEAAWFDSAGAIWNARLNQQANPFSSSNTEEVLIPLDENTAIKDLYNEILTASVDDGLSAGYAQWSQDWTNGFQADDSFATMLCPSWMLGVIEGNASGVTGWDVANAFPGGGGNWGGSYLTVPSMGKNKEEAKKLAAWLTAPEQQIEAFKAKGTFPSQVKALESEALMEQTNEFFNDAPVGKIMAERAEAVTVTPFMGPKFFTIATIISDAINRVEVDKVDDAASSWAKAVDEFNSLQ